MGWYCKKKTKYFFEQGIFFKTGNWWRGLNWDQCLARSFSSKPAFPKHFSISNAQDCFQGVLERGNLNVWVSQEETTSIETRKKVALHVKDGKCSPKSLWEKKIIFKVLNILPLLLANLPLSSWIIEKAGQIAPMVNRFGKVRTLRRPSSSFFNG